MTMRREYTALHVMATFTGFMCLAVLIGSNVQHQYETIGTLLDASVATVIVVTAANTVVFACFLAASRQFNLLLAACLLTATAFASTFEITTTLDRVAQQRSARMEEKLRADPHGQTLLALREKVTYLAARECAGGRGKKCEAIEGEVEVANNRLKARFEELDAGARTFQAVTFGYVPASVAALVQPALPALSLFLLAVFLPAFGMAGRRVKPEFSMTLSKGAAIDARAARFAAEFQRVHGRKPKPAEISANLGVTPAVAARLAGPRPRAKAQLANGHAVH